MTGEFAYSDLLGVSDKRVRTSPVVELPQIGLALNPTASARKPVIGPYTVGPMRANASASLIALGPRSIGLYRPTPFGGRSVSVSLCTDSIKHHKENVLI